MTNKIVTPRHILIEKVAGECAAVFYEAGRSTGLKSKYPDARSYAKAHLEKFVPKAVEILLGMLNDPRVPQFQKNEIYEAVIERANDPELKFMDKPRDKKDISVIHNQPVLDDETIREAIAKLDPNDFVFKNPN